MVAPFFKECPLWAMLGLIGGLFAFLGIFMGVLGYNLEGVDNAINAIDILKGEYNDVFNASKFLPLITGIIGLVMAIFCLYSMGAGNFTGSKVPVAIMGILGIVALVLIVGWIIMCFHGSVFVEKLDGYHACAGSWFMLLGGILGVIATLICGFRDDL